MASISPSSAPADSASDEVSEQKEETAALSSDVVEEAADDETVEDAPSKEMVPIPRTVMLTRRKDRKTDKEEEREQATIPDLNVIFGMSEDERREYLRGFGVSYGYLRTVQSIPELESYFQSLDLIAEVEYPGVWLLLSMTHEERNAFLESIGYEPLLDDSSVRNIDELIQAVQKDRWPGILERFEPLLEESHLVPAVELTKRILIDREVGDEYKDFCKLPSLGAALSLMEERRKRYYVLDPDIWLLITLPSERRNQVFSTFRKHIGNIIPSSGELIRKLKIRETNFKNIEAFRSWFNSAVSLLLSKKLSRDETGSDGKVRELVSQLLVHSTRGAKKYYIKYQTPRRRFGYMSILHMVGKKAREYILKSYGLEYSDVEILPDHYTLRKLLTHHCILPTREPQYFERHWRIFNVPTSKREVIGDFCIKNVGDFLDWMHISKDYRYSMALYESEDESQDFQQIIQVRCMLKSVLLEIEQEKIKAQRKAEKEAEKKRKKKARQRKNKTRASSGSTTSATTSASDISLETSPGSSKTEKESQ